MSIETHRIPRRAGRDRHFPRAFSEVGAAAPVRRSAGGEARSSSCRAVRPGGPTRPSGGARRSPGPGRCRRRKRLPGGSFMGGDWAFLAGRWYDIGKYSTDFQKRLKDVGDPDAHIENAAKRPDHSTAGAQHAVSAMVWKLLPPVYRQCAVCYTDFRAPYEEIFPKNRHRPVGKDSGGTNRIERFNCTSRRRISRLEKRYSFLKKLKTILAPFGILFITTML